MSPSGRARPARGQWRLLVALLVLAAAGSGVLVWRLGPALKLTVELASPAAEAWLEPLGQRVSRREVTIDAGGRTLAADLYRPPAPQGALLLVHGLSRLGRRQPDLERLAWLLARQGQVVLVPHFEGLAAFRLNGREVADVRAAVRYLRAEAGRVGVAGFSFGAGPTLLAVSNVPGLRVVGSFGGYADLGNVIKFVTTGVHAFNGQRHVQPPDEYNRWKMLALLAAFVEDRRDRRVLEALAVRRLAHPGRVTEGPEVALGPEGRRVWNLVSNRQEALVEPLLADLPDGARKALQALSPLPALRHLSGHLLVAHGAADRSIPFTESLRLAAAGPPGSRVVILRTFDHTGPQTLWRSLADQAEDGWRLLGLVDALLAAR